MLFYPVPFNVPIGYVGFGSMEGIDPYIKTIGACHSTYRVVAWGCGRLVAAPTVQIKFTARVNGRQSSGNVGDDAHIVPLRGVPPVKRGNVIFPPSHSTHQSVPWASGRWRASTPTLKPWARSIQRTGWLREVSGGWVAAPTGRIMFTARVNGRQSSGNVGDDAHIVPLRGVPPG